MHELNINLMDLVSLPQATPEKNVFIFLITNCSDGIGDFYHGWDLANKCKAALNSKGYAVFGLVDVNKLYTSEEELEEFKKNAFAEYTKCISRNKIYKEIKNKLENKEEDLTKEFPFDDYILLSQYYRIQDDRIICSDSEIQKKIDYIYAHSAGAMKVSYRFGNLPCPAKVQSVTCYEYGDVSSEDGVYDFPMGIPVGESSMNSREASQISGIKMNTNPIGTLEVRSERLLSLGKNEPDFLNTLLRTTNPTLLNAKDYLQNNHFMPSYLQTVNEACAMVLIHVLQYKSDIASRGCDFLLPSNVVDNKMITELLEKEGVSSDEIGFMSSSENIEPNKKYKVRIFSNRIKSDIDYENLFRVSSDGAGCSGNSSMSTVFSSDNLPFYGHKMQSDAALTKFMKVQIIGFIQQCIKEFESVEDASLILGMKQLNEYLSLITDFKDKLGLSGEKDRSERKKILGDDFRNLCNKVADLKKGDNIQKAWHYFSNRLKIEHNVYNEIDRIAKVSVVASSTDPAVRLDVLSAILGTDDIKFLFDKKIIDLNALDNMSLNDLMMLTWRPIREYLVAEFIGLEFHRTRILMNTHIEKNKVSKEMVAFLKKIEDNKLAVLGEEYSRELSQELCRPKPISVLYRDDCSSSKFLENTKFNETKQENNEVMSEISKKQKEGK